MPSSDKNLQKGFCKAHLKFCNNLVNKLKPMELCKNSNITFKTKNNKKRKKGKKNKQLTKKKY